MDRMFSLSTLSLYTDIYPGYWGEDTFRFWMSTRGMSLSLFAHKWGARFADLYYRCVRNQRP